MATARRYLEPVQVLHGDSHYLNLKLTQHISRPKTYHVTDPEDDRFQESDKNDD